MKPDIRSLAKEYKFGNSLVFIRGKRFPDYASAAAYNHVDLSDRVPLYVWDRSPEVRGQVLRSYPDRLVWIVNGPSITGRGFKVIEGPMPADELAPQRIPSHKS